MFCAFFIAFKDLTGDRYRYPVSIIKLEVAELGPCEGYTFSLYCDPFLPNSLSLLCKLVRLSGVLPRSFTIVIVREVYPAMLLTSLPDYCDSIPL